jgi:uncharacterized protein with von Willebrand factor type A (vWA) domain
LISEIEIAISAIESGIVENIANQALAFHESMVVIGDKNSIKSSLNNWKLKITKQLKTTPIDSDIQDEMDYYEEVKDYNKTFFTENIENIIKKIGIHSPFYSTAMDLFEKQKVKYNPLFQFHFCDQWYESLFNHVKEERIEKIEKEKLLKELYQRSETISQLNEIDNNTNEQKNLRLWDMARAKLSKRDVSQLSKITRFLQQNEDLYNMAKKLGRMANEVDSGHISDVKIEKTRKIETKSTYFAGDIVGIHDSDDLERLLATETMYLTNPDLETIFYKHLADKRLATYQLQSTEQQNEKIITYEKRAKNATLDKGPFIVAIDASGSMMGKPEQYAKAFAYALMQIALTENRDCYIIIFSTQTITYELTKEKGLSEILSFLSYTFNGGTDLAPVLEQSVDLMNSEKYINADLVIISDFIAPAQSEIMLEKMSKLKRRKNRFHALNLSRYGNPELLASFDHYWQYTPSRLGRLKQLFKD